MPNFGVRATLAALVKLSPDTHSADDVVRLFGLAPLEQEGGFFRRTSESALVIPGGALAGPHREPRRAWSLIYALFTPDGISAMHRLASDELWFFHAGDPLESLRLHVDGRGEWAKLGLDVSDAQRPQDIIAAGVWQGTRLVDGGRWALVSCVVAPEFVWSDFELGERARLAAEFPEYAGAVVALTR